MRPGSRASLSRFGAKTSTGRLHVGDTCGTSGRKLSKSGLDQGSYEAPSRQTDSFRDAGRAEKAGRQQLTSFRACRWWPIPLSGSSRRPSSRVSGVSSEQLDAEHSPVSPVYLATACMEARHGQATEAA
jgi:hypothetical protein